MRGDVVDAVFERLFEGVEELALRGGDLDFLAVDAGAVAEEFSDGGSALAVPSPSTVASAKAGSHWSISSARANLVRALEHAEDGGGGEGFGGGGDEEERLGGDGIVGVNGPGAGGVGEKKIVAVGDGDLGADDDPGSGEGVEGFGMAMREAGGSASVGTGKAGVRALAVRRRTRARGSFIGGGQRNSVSDIEQGISNPSSLCLP